MPGDSASTATGRAAFRMMITSMIMMIQHCCVTVSGSKTTVAIYGDLWDLSCNF